MALPAGVDAVAFGDLKRAYDSGSVVVFAGAGVSASAGVPTWGELATRLIDRMRQLQKPKDDIDDAEDYVRRGRLVEAMSAVRASLGQDFVHEIKRHVDDRGKPVPPLAQAIAGLERDLKGVVTTNLDRLLERAFQGAWPAILQPVQDLVQRTGYIFKPHGTIDDPSDWVFTRADYDRAMFGSQPLQTLFEALYHGRTLLFVGASLTDDDFGLTLARVRALAGVAPPTHYAILPRPVRRTQQTDLERAGVRLLLYDNASGDHREAVEILHELSGALPAGATRVAVPQGPVAAPAPGVTPGGASPGGAVGGGRGPGGVVSPGAGPNSPSATAPGGHATPARAVAGRPVPPAEPVLVFLSATRADEKIRDKLASHLQPLVDFGRIRIRSEKDVAAGADRTATLNRLLADAGIVLVLVSAEYLASKEHMNQADRALAAMSAGVVVIPVIARACGWDFGALGKLKPVPKDGKPIASHVDTDAALLEVVRSVQAVLDGWNAAGGGVTGTLSRF